VTGEDVEDSDDLARTLTLPLATSPPVDQSASEGRVGEDYRDRFADHS